MSNKTAKRLWLLPALMAAWIAGCQQPTEKVSTTEKPAAKKVEKKTTRAPARAKGGMVQAAYAYPTGDRSTSSVMVEKMAPAEVQVGREFTYTIKVTNIADCDLDDVVVTDRLMNNFDMKSSVPKTDDVSGGNASWNLGSIAQGESMTIKATGAAKGKGTMTGCSKVAYRAPLCLSLVAVEPALKLVKTAPADVLICDPIPVRYVVTNTGSGTARNVQITDTFASGMVGKDGKGNISFMAGDLAAGASRDFVVNASAYSTGKLGSEAKATADGGLTTASAAHTTVREPVLAISSSAPSKTFVGGKFTYEITISNKGDVASDDTVINSTIPAGVKFSSATDGGRHAAGKVTWNVGNLSPNATKKVGVTYAADRIATAKSTAAVQGTCAKQVTTAANTELIGIPAILMEVVDLSDPIMVGDEETYVITATNQGSAAGTNIAITCTLEDTMQYVSSSGPSKASVAGATVKFAPLPSLAPKAKAAWRVTVKAAKMGDVRFKVSLKSDQITRTVDETEATNFYQQ